MYFCFPGFTFAGPSSFIAVNETVVDYPPCKIKVKEANSWNNFRL